MRGHGIPLAFYPTQTPPRVGTHLVRAHEGSCSFLKREALVVKDRGTEFCRRAAGFAGLAIGAFPAEKSVDHSPTDQRGTHAGHLMRCRSRNSLGFDLISLAFFGPLFMAPGRFRPFPLPLRACSGRAKNRRGAGLVRSDRSTCNACRASFSWGPASGSYRYQLQPPSLLAF